MASGIGTTVSFNNGVTIRNDVSLDTSHDDFNEEAATDDLLAAAMRESGMEFDAEPEEDLQTQLANLLVLLEESYGKKDASSLMKPLMKAIVRETAVNVIRAPMEKPASQPSTSSTAPKHPPEQEKRSECGFDLGFLMPKKPAKRKAVEQPPEEISTSNCFSALETAGTPIAVDAAAYEQPEVQKPPGRKRKVPPIFVKAPSDPMEMSRIIREKFGDQTKSSLSGKSLRIQPHDPDAYRAIRKQLDLASLEYNTYLLAEDKPYKVVVKGLPTGDSEEERKQNTERLISSLKDQGLTPSHVAPMKSFRTKKYMPMYLVELPKNTAQSGIFNIKECHGMQAHVAPHRRRRGIGQCFRCQGFYHSSICCTAQPRCVKCAGKHLSKACEKTREEPPTCVNCNGTHTANFRGCPSFPKNPANVTSKRPERQPEAPRRNLLKDDFPELPSHPVPTMRAPTTTSYAEKTKKADESRTRDSIQLVISILDTVKELLNIQGLNPKAKSATKKLLKQALDFLDCE